ncbi:hypothetical protein K7X08_002553 [Anisodus acutangulus]|uniref:Pentatricopeptide repeat-containing protein n=1 Tax=Anisodus acutangulus TaxID=402998 RepID=A0A9Q1LT47_9SOLA|nr:hypothetical protein K7X08_002553 [Anisodus acutangulus]
MGLEYDVFVRVCLVEMYVKIELVDLSLQLFDESPERNKVDNVLLWNVVINGCKTGRALDLFFKMVEEGAKPNGLTVVSALSACAKTGALEAGRKIDDNISNNGLHLNATVGAGRWDDVERVRNSMKNKTVEKDPGWSSMEVDGQLHTCVAESSRFKLFSSLKLWDPVLE